MKHLLIKTLAGSGLLLMTLTASGQYYPRPDREQTQDEREAREPSRVFDRVRGDLDRAQGGALPFTADRTRVTIAREEVSECQRILRAGEYDRRQFDEAIVAVQRVAELNRLSDNNRDNLLDDIRDLRRVQSRFES
jgi:hypothetical protein